MKTTTLLPGQTVRLRALGFDRPIYVTADKHGRLTTSTKLPEWRPARQAAKATTNGKAPASGAVSLDAGNAPTAPRPRRVFPPRPERCTLCLAKITTAFAHGTVTGNPHVRISMCLTCNSRWAGGTEIFHIVKGEVK